MLLLANELSRGQAVTLILLCVFLVIFIVVDVLLVFSLRRKNKALAKKAELSDNETENAEQADL